MFLPFACKIGHSSLLVPPPPPLLLSLLSPPPHYLFVSNRSYEMNLSTPPMSPLSNSLHNVSPSLPNTCTRSSSQYQRALGASLGLTLPGRSLAWRARRSVFSFNLFPQAFMQYTNRYTFSIALLLCLSSLLPRIPVYYLSFFTIYLYLSISLALSLPRRRS